MFFDSGAWPPPPDGFDPPPSSAPRMSAAQERSLMRLIGLLLVAMFLGPIAGSSMIVPIISLVRAAIAAAG